MRYTIVATVKRESDSVLIDKEESFFTEQACICFMKELNTYKNWKGDRGLALVCKPTIICNYYT